MDAVVPVLLQTLPVACEEVSVTSSPWQKVVAPPAVIVGTAGFAFTVTARSVVAVPQLLVAVARTVKSAVALLTAPVLASMLAPPDRME